jgi:hypothetical protein
MIALALGLISTKAQLENQESSYGKSPRSRR